MSEPSDPNLEKNALRDQIIGLGSRSLRKSYYPQLQQQIDELKEAKAALEEKSDSLLRTLTDLEAARQRAEENERKFRTLFEGISDGVVVADPDTGQLRMVNAAFCRMLGYSEAELLQLSITDLHPPKEFSRVTADMGDRARGIPGLLANLAFKRKDGTIFYTDISGTSIDLENQHCVMGVCRDITERKLAQEALNREQEFSRALVENIVDAVVACNADFKLTLFNRAAREWHGVDAMAIPPEQWGEYYHLYCSDGVTPMTVEDNPLARAVRGETLHNEPMVIRAENQPPRYVLANSASFFDDQGRLLGAVAVLHDITERKRAEEELRCLNRLYAVLSQVNQAVIHAESHQELLEEVCKISIAFGGFKMTWVGKVDPQTHQVIPVAAAGAHQGFLDKVRVFADDRPEGRGTVGISLREERICVTNDFLHFAGTLPWRELGATFGFKSIISLPLRNEGEIYGALVVYAGELDFFQDKEVKLLEEVAADISFALDHIDREMRRQQNEAALKQAKEAAEAANRAKDQFIAVLSHELRTPLTPVLTAVTLLRSHEALPEEIRSDFEVIHRNVELEAKLIDDLLDVTRISRGVIELHSEDVDVHACLMKSLEICRSEIGQKAIEVSLSLRARDFHVWADSARLQQVFWNLLKNAVKFTPHEGRISIRSINLDKWLKIEVADTGVGIEPDLLPRIFNAFEQGETTSTRRFGGLGLGLSIAKAVVELHNGSLTAYSAGRNKGAVFAVALETMGHAAGAPVASVAALTRTDKGRKILLVEDHADTLHILSRLLQKWGYRVECADCVAKALELAQGESFDILISDIGLPDGSGLDIMRQMKERYGLRGIALSGFGTDEDLRQSHAAGFDQHLTKPIGVGGLRAAVERIMAERRE